MTDDPTAAIRAALRKLPGKIGRHRDSLESLYAERDQLYLEAVALGVPQILIAEWAGSTPDAVGQALRKLRVNGAR